ncbi:golgi integral membrane protein [Colletotrichum incanum]|uniref:Protein BTN n=1 Tax=Colletotrichum incanum TaxID=1573173 RepID=A0A161WM07_COLIC|nr:golgi integral membrane protein [Colletotrichum incanum]OHW99561.1 Golgi integral membrane protein [Colletotrichum incanum]
MAARSKTTGRTAMPCSFENFRIFWGFAIVGLVNTILPSIVHAANYLIIPYPRHAVILIEFLPALLTKLSLPFVIRRIPCRVRPLIVAVGWFIAKRIADDTPPNVLPPVRIVTTVLASVASAATEVSCLGMIGHAGAPALAGWGFGTGAGLLENAVWPFLLTYGAGKVLRSATGYMYYLIAMLLVSHFIVLPQNLTKRGKTNGERGKDREDAGAEEGRSFLSRDESTSGSTSPKGISRKFRTLRGMVRSDMFPLFVASASLSLLQYGLARPLDGSAFETFSHFYTTYGISIHLGSWLGRSSVSLLPVRNLKLHLVALGVWIVVALFNAVFLVSTYIAFFLAFLVGFVGGSMYVNVLARVKEERKDQADRELGLGLVTAGDAGGVIVGGVLGAFLETAMCGSLVSGKRWCHRSR